tara:strand:+ start:484 stop:666 length:183 start_codon:yes stop_codon:yes gene_type:complete
MKLNEHKKKNRKSILHDKFGGDTSEYNRYRRLKKIQELKELEDKGFVVKSAFELIFGFKS